MSDGYANTFSSIEAATLSVTAPSPTVASPVNHPKSTRTNGWMIGTILGASSSILMFTLMCFVLCRHHRSRVMLLSSVGHFLRKKQATGIVATWPEQNPAKTGGGDVIKDQTMTLYVVPFS